MLRLPSKRLAPGMILGRQILGHNGRILLTPGQMLTERYIKRIQELKITMVEIDDQMGVQDAPGLVSPVVISKTTQALKNTYEECAKTGKANLVPIQSQIDNIIDDLLTNNNLIIGISDLKSYDDYTYQHSVNVSVLALTMGISLGSPRAQLQSLGIGALLHDIGKISIPVEILNKRGPLTEEEYDIVKKHPTDGFNLLRSSAAIPHLSAQVALQHHERLDGQGYPRGLSQGKIHDFGLMVAAADVFDALISDRPYRRGFNNQEAIHIIEQSKHSQLSPKFADLLLKHINIYPPGSVVKLSNGDTAVVTAENPKNNKAPQVKLLFDAAEKIYDQKVAIDLAKDNRLSISKALSTADAEQTICLYISLLRHKMQYCAGSMSS